MRGTVTGTGEFLPRIPPFRGRVGLRYQRNAFQAGGEMLAVAQQDRVSGLETPTDGYGLLKLYASYRCSQARGCTRSPRAWTT